VPNRNFAYIRFASQKYCPGVSLYDSSRVTLKYPMREQE
jgi:hypothetical protein